MASSCWNFMTTQIQCKGSRHYPPGNSSQKSAAITNFLSLLFTRPWLKINLLTSKCLQMITNNYNCLKMTLKAGHKTDHDASPVTVTLNCTISVKPKSSFGDDFISLPPFISSQVWNAALPWAVSIVVTHLHRAASATAPMVSCWQTTAAPVWVSTMLIFLTKQKSVF